MAIELILGRCPSMLGFGNGIVMMIRKSIVLGAMCLALSPFIANAQSQYQAAAPAPLPAPPAAAAPAIPASWYYNPYTSGVTTCVQWSPTDPQSCRDQKIPSYSVPSYGPAIR